MEEQKESPSREANDSRRVKAPDRRKHEEEVEGYQNRIRDLEVQLAAVKSEKNVHVLSEIRSEKEDAFTKVKKINGDLKTLNLDISEKTNKISQMQSGLVYKNEEKHNDAIRKLEWNLAHHSYRLTEERKIVAEIDKLKRSKKSLCTFNSAKNQIDELRGRQRKLREERDHYSKAITTLRSQEDDIKRKLSTNRVQLQLLKLELDEQYQAKRRVVEEFKKQQAEYLDAQKKKKKQSFVKKAEERKAIIEAKQNEQQELEKQSITHEEEHRLCNTLISYLQQRFSLPENLGVTNDKIQITSVVSPQNQVVAATNGPAEELEDGNLILLKKSDDSELMGSNLRKQNKKIKKHRKPSMTKLITHCAQVIGQFASLNLRVPCSAQEIPASLEQLRARKLFYEQSAETESNVSLTESGICEMSRQASNTESCDSMSETRPPDFVLDDIHKNCCPDSSFPANPESQSTDSNHTPRNLSLSSGSVMSVDADDLDSNCQSLDSSYSHMSQLGQSVDSSYSHLSQIGESELGIKHGQSLDMGLSVAMSLNTNSNQSNTVFYNTNDGPQLNQSVALSQNINLTCNVASKQHFETAANKNNMHDYNCGYVGKKCTDSDDVCKNYTESDDGYKKCTESDDLCKLAAESDDVCKEKAEFIDVCQKNTKSFDKNTESNDVCESELLLKNTKSDEVNEKNTESDDVSEKNTETDDVNEKNTESDDACEKNTKSDDVNEKNTESDDVCKSVVGNVQYAGVIERKNKFTSECIDKESEWHEQKNSHDEGGIMGNEEEITHL